MKNAFISILLLVNFSVLAQTNADNSDSSSDKNAPLDATEQLLNAARSGDMETLKLLLNKGADVNAKDTNGTTALMGAVMTGRTDAAKLLLDKGADINAKDYSVGTPLMIAAYQGNASMVKLLLDNDADINTKVIGVLDDTALMSAVMSCNTNVVELLLDKGASINQKDSRGQTALINATILGDTNVVKLLLAKGADINTVDTDGETVSGIAIRMGNAAIMQLLQPVNLAVASGTNTDSSGYVTNVNLLTPFTMTNSGGDVVTNAVLVKLTPNKFIYKTDNGAEGMMPLGSLPKDLQEKFGYDQTLATAQDDIDKTKNEIDRQNQIGAAQQAIYQEKVRQTTAYIKSCEMHWMVTVIQNVPDGLLVRCPDDTTALIVDLNKETVTDDEQIECRLYPYGVYSYESVNNSQKTVRKLTPNLDHAVSYKLANPN
ncbi:MAG TPA: ankyrin repeat domain-containing protein [Candidatus Saccharimonadales bacterium]|nr:ankyrin repeat domain-containing protein [Candidatus Saccharimonadales bacterium]